jgi:hypothetical protein
MTLERAVPRPPLVAVLLTTSSSSSESSMIRSFLPLRALPRGGRFSDSLSLASLDDCFNCLRAPRPPRPAGFFTALFALPRTGLLTVVGRLVSFCPEFVSFDS